MNNVTVINKHDRRTAVRLLIPVFGFSVLLWFWLLFLLFMIVSPLPSSLLISIILMVLVALMPLPSFADAVTTTSPSLIPVKIPLWLIVATRTLLTLQYIFLFVAFVGVISTDKLRVPATLISSLPTMLIFVTKTSFLSSMVNVVFVLAFADDIVTS